MQHVIKLLSGETITITEESEDGMLSLDLPPGYIVADVEHEDGTTNVTLDKEA